MANNNLDMNHRKHRSGRIVLKYDKNEETSDIDMEPHDNTRKRNYPEDEKVKDKKVKSKKNKTTDSVKLNEGETNVNVRDEDQDREGNDKQCTFTRSSNVSLESLQQEDTASPFTEEGFFSSPPSPTASNQQPPDPRTLPPSQTLQIDAEGLRVTPDFDITTTDAEILQNISSGMRNAPSRKKRTPKKNKLLNYLSRPFKFTSFMSSFKRDSGFDDSSKC
uniref:Uncharacterized protein n=1 Tax=Strongyloides venezuelensis TaxID=75913 RepID=A0A0K0EYU3_STRVS